VTLSAHEIILRPVISEKTMDESQRGKYTFAVRDDVNKIQIEAAIEEIFKVKVAAVNVLTTKSKLKRGGTRRSRVAGRPSPWGPGRVTLAPGQKIEFFEAV
jgi:large subunit ribosomal protein L23